MRKVAVFLRGVDLARGDDFPVMKKWQASPDAEEILFPYRVSFESEAGNSGRGIHENDVLAIGDRGARAAVAEASGELQGVLADDLFFPKNLAA